MTLKLSAVGDVDCWIEALAIFLERVLHLYDYCCCCCCLCWPFGCCEKLILKTPPQSKSGIRYTVEDDP